MRAFLSRFLGKKVNFEYKNIFNSPYKLLSTYFSKFLSFSYSSLAYIVLSLLVFFILLLFLPSLVVVFILFFLVDKYLG